MLNTRRLLGGVLAVLLVSSLAGAQTVPTVVGQTDVKTKPRTEPVPKIPASEPRQSVPPAKPKSPCPDGAFQQACDSYAELLKARDAGVSFDMTPGGLAMICFRGTTDSFFVVALSAPENAKGHFDRDSLKFVPDDYLGAMGYGRVTEFNNGITSTSGTMPISGFGGDWGQAGRALWFNATRVEAADVDEHSGVSVDTSSGFFGRPSLYACHHAPDALHRFQRPLLLITWALDVIVIEGIPPQRLARIASKN